MASMNNVCLIGRLTHDFELKKTNSGLSVLQFRLAVNRRFEPKNGPSADFINCVAWRQQAEFLAKYGVKGQLMSVEGEIQTRDYKHSAGHTVYVTEVVANQVSLLERRERQQDPREYQAQVSPQQLDYTTVPTQVQTQAQTQAPMEQQTTLDDVSVDLTNEDLPF